MFLVAALMFAPLVASMPWAESASWMSSVGKEHRVAHGGANLRAVGVTMVLMSLTVSSACSVNIFMLVIEVPKLASVCALSTCCAQIRHRGIQFFGRFVNALDEARRAARHFLQVERRLASTSALLVSTGGLFVVGMTETYWSPRNPDCSMTKRAS